MPLSNKLGYDISIDSHSSKINNARIIHRFALADEYNVTAANNPTIPNIHAYFNELDCIFINVGSVLINSLSEKTYMLIVQKIHAYKRLYRICLAQPNMRRTLDLMELAKQFNFLLTSSLQDLQFFFRMGQRGKKGLRYIDMLYKNGGVTNDLERKDESKESAVEGTD